MRKLLAFSISLILAELSFCQNIVNGRITNIAGEPISYATIGSLTENYGCYSDSLGIYNLKYLNLSDSIGISCIGYKEQLSTVLNLIDTPQIILERESIAIDEVIIKSHKLRKKKLGLGITKKTHDLAELAGHFNFKAIFIPFPKKGNIVRVLTVCLTYQKVDNMPPYRIHILKVGNDGMPAKDLVVMPELYNDVYNIENSISFQKIDISKYGIRIPKEGVFVAIEFCYDLAPGDERKTGWIFGKYTKKENVLWRKSLNGEWEKYRRDYNLAIGIECFNSKAYRYGRER